MRTHNIPSYWRKSKKKISLLCLLAWRARWLTLNSSNYPCPEHIFIVPKVFEPLKFDCILYILNSLVMSNSRVFKTQELNFNSATQQTDRFNAIIIKHVLIYHSLKSCAITHSMESLQVHNFVSVVILEWIKRTFIVIKCISRFFIL